MRVFALVLLSLITLLSGTARAAEPISVVASFSILGDLSARVGGARVRVHTLVGPDGDAHVFQPTPTDAKALARAQLVVVNGLGFEGWISRLVKSAGYRGPVLTASQGIATLKAESAHAHEHGHQHAAEVDADPHAWQDLSKARQYVANIAAALIQVDPAGKAEYQANADKLEQEIAELDAEIRRQLGSLPADRRTVVTSHDAFAYFARAYGIRFRAPVGVSTNAAASAAEVGRLIRQIKKEKIPAVFMENISDPRLLERIRAETGARIGGTLYSDALSTADGPAASYLAMMRHNAKALAAALQP
jgi:zinc/manganese transport system substrate-binding protein